MIRINRCLYSPVVRGLGASVNSSLPYSRGALNPSVVTFNGKVYLYFRGHDKDDVKTICAWQRDYANYIVDGENWFKNTAYNPIVSPTAGTADADGCLNPSAAVFNDQVYMYYIGKNGTTPTIMLATSLDGLTFTKIGVTDIASIAGAFGCFAFGEKLYIVMNYGLQPTGGFDLWIAETANGTSFSSPVRIMGVSGDAEWDGKSIVTCRCYFKDPYAYMFYAASQDFRDYNEGIGLARSHKDSSFLVWEKHPDNPVFLRGGGGTWDSSGLWSPSPVLFKNRGLVFYEGVGMDSVMPGGASENASRETPYDGYDSTSFSSVGCGELNSFDYEAVWETDFPAGKFLLRNVGTGLYVSCENRATTVVDSVYPQIVLADEPNDSSLWTVERSSQGAFAVIKAASGLAISVFDEDYGTQTVAKIGLTNYDSTRRLSEWMLYEKEHGVFSIQSRRSGLFMAPYGGSRSSGTYLNQELEFNCQEQMFQFIRVDNP